MRSECGREGHRVAMLATPRVDVAEYLYIHVEFQHCPLGDASREHDFVRARTRTWLRGASSCHFVV